MRVHRWLLGAVMVLATAPAWGIPPHFCREHLVGVLERAGVSENRVNLKLVVRDDLGAISVSGRLRCPANPDNGDCLVGRSTIQGFLDGPDPHGRDATLNVGLSDRRAPTTQCHVTLAIPFIFQDCIPTMIGTVTCSTGGQQAAVASLALVARACGRCVR